MISNSVQRKLQDFGNKVADKALRLLATGRLPYRGAMFRLQPDPSKLVGFSEKPCIYPFLNRYFPEGVPGTFLVLETSGEYLWSMEVRVLFSNEQDDTFIGWLPYHEFCQIIRPEWDTWDEDQNQ